VTPLNGKGMLIISKGGQKGWYWHIVGGQWYVVWAKNMVKTGDQHVDLKIEPRKDAWREMVQWQRVQKEGP
jgi:hypothetical protein